MLMLAQYSEWKEKLSIIKDDRVMEEDTFHCILLVVVVQTREKGFI